MRDFFGVRKWAGEVQPVRAAARMVKLGVPLQAGFIADADRDEQKAIARAKDTKPTAKATVPPVKRSFFRRLFGVK
jgi:hypothetical protein